MDAVGRSFEFTVAGKLYEAKSGNAEDQLELLAKISPLLASGIGELIPFFMEVRREGIANIGDLAMERIGQITTPVARELSKMSRQDRHEIISACMSVCKRKMDGENTGWTPVWNSTAQMAMFDDIQNDVSVTLQIVWCVIQGIFNRFFPESALASLRKR